MADSDIDDDLFGDIENQPNSFFLDNLKLGTSRILIPPPEYVDLPEFEDFKKDHNVKVDE